MTDTAGRYNVIDLRPGRYSVTFALAGFSTVRREGIELSAGFTATVNADLQVGSLAETITVSGAAPMVDTQNVSQQRVITMEVLRSLPNTGTNFAALTPGASRNTDVGGSSGSDTGATFTIHLPTGAAASHSATCSTSAPSVSPGVVVGTTRRSMIVAPSASTAIDLVPPISTPARRGADIGVSAAGGGRAVGPA